MNITVVEVDNAKLWNGTKVRNKRTGAIREIFVIPEGKTISQCARDGEFTIKNVDFQTVMLNKHLFELVE